MLKKIALICYFAITLCQGIELLFSENWSEPNPDSRGWTRSAGSGSPGWQYGTSTDADNNSGFSIPEFNATNPNVIIAYTNTDQCVCDGSTDYLDSPNITLPTTNQANGLFLVFDQYYDGYNGQIFVVTLSIDDFITESVITPLPYTIPVWFTTTLSLNQWAGQTVRIRFWSDGYAQGGVGLGPVFVYAVNGTYDYTAHYTFDDGLIPAGFYETHNPTANGWLLNTTFELSSTFFNIPDPLTGNSYVYADNDDLCGQTCDSSNDTLGTPVYDVSYSNSVAIMIQFDYVYTGEDGEVATFELSYDGGQTWFVACVFLPLGITAWQQHYQDLSIFFSQETTPFSFRWLANDTGNWASGFAVKNVFLWNLYEGVYNPITTVAVTSGGVTSAAMTSSQLTTSQLTTSPVTTKSASTTASMTTAPGTSAPMTTQAITSGLTSQSMTTSAITSSRITTHTQTTTAAATTKAPVGSSTQLISSVLLSLVCAFVAFF